ncbi:hypothetical protein OUZ56_007934 [Daphnia magna]|uniref:Uncharacterized protein n=1 Tax=Daphnia magna TaxID=35525 RepID=A0ABR0ABI3_9CRUS|nr:hypothetical protein OUZ56_007934 [Daphnia magna]
MGITRQAYQSALNHFITAQLVTPIVVDVGRCSMLVGRVTIDLQFFYYQTRPEWPYSLKQEEEVIIGVSMVPGGWKGTLTAFECRFVSLTGWL